MYCFLHDSPRFAYMHTCIQTYINTYTQLMTGNYEWAGDIVGLEKNPEVVKDLTEMCEYLVKVLTTMSDSPYKRHVMDRTNYKLSVRVLCVRVSYSCT